MGISGAYAARRRDPIFAAAWDAALSIARERLADTLLARAMEGNVEQIYRDGELVGERHFLDNRLGLAILRRLDRLAERDLRSMPIRPHPQARTSPTAPCGPRRTFDWTLAVDALRTGDDHAAPGPLAPAQGNEVEEVEDPESSPPRGPRRGPRPLRPLLVGRGRRLLDDRFPAPAGFQRPTKPALTTI